MATFNFAGFSIDTSTATGEEIATALQDAGVTVNGSIVAGSTFGVSGGTHHGDVHGDERKSE
ncbi:hypothetical protein ACFQ8C_19165 [Streptomyces sp. NPDC056503]|uniref:hypothetical protein n=1 Tax=Streptomyces sp. NPDC056503 TaxID=3345842 RepID=UPI0036C31DAA